MKYFFYLLTGRFQLFLFAIKWQAFLEKHDPFISMFDVVAKRCRQAVNPLQSDYFQMRDIRYLLQLMSGYHSLYPKSYFMGVAGDLLAVSYRMGLGKQGDNIFEIRDMFDAQGNDQLFFGLQTRSVKPRPTMFIYRYLPIRQHSGKSKRECVLNPKLWLYTQKSSKNRKIKLEDFYYGCGKDAIQLIKMYEDTQHSEKRDELVRKITHFADILEEVVANFKPLPAPVTPLTPFFEKFTLALNTQTQ